MFTTHNATVVGVKLRGTDLSKTGQPTYDYFTFDPATEPMLTWVDFSVARKMELIGRDTMVDATWEVRGWIQERIREKAGRMIQTGDLVQFSMSPVLLAVEPPQVADGLWFTLMSGASDTGMFGSIPFQKFNLKQSHRS